MVVLVASGLGLHFSGIIDQFLEDRPPPKKISAVKPKAIREKSNKVSSTPDQPDFTFFETLNDTTMTRYVKLNGEVSPAKPVPEKATTPAKVKEASQPVVKVSKSASTKASGQKTGSRPAANPVLQATIQPIIQTRYTVQVSSFRDEGRASALKMRLQKNGFDSFVIKTELPNGGGIWHRVFLGRYEEEKKAQDAAHLAKSKYNLNAVVVSKVN